MVCWEKDDKVYSLYPKTEFINFQDEHNKSLEQIEHH